MLKPEYILFICIVVFLISCGDLQKPSATSKCDDALNSSNWDVAISNCSSSKSKGDAYMGKAGFTVINLTKDAEAQPNHVKNADSSKFTGLDVNGAKILKIIGAAYSALSSSSDRNTKIVASKNAFNSAMDNYYKIITSDKDAALMYTYANIFALQLEQLSLYDNLSKACKSTTECSGDNEYKDSEFDALENLDGYYYAQEKTAKELSYAGNTGKIITTYCGDLKNTVLYVGNTALGLSKTGISSTSGSTTVITDILKTTCTLMKGLYDKCNQDSDQVACQKACDTQTKCVSTSPEYDFW